MKIFVDECIDWRLAREIVGHEVSTAREMGWTTLKNGELLTRTSKQFDVFLTVDRNLSFQQNLPTFDIAVVVLRCNSNRLLDLRRLVPDLLACLSTVRSGTITYVGV